MKMKSGLVKTLAMVLAFGICSILIIAGTGFTEVFTPIISPVIPSHPIPATIITPMPDACSGCTAGNIVCCQELATSFKKLYQRLQSLEARETQLEREMTELKTSMTIKMQQLQAQITAVQAEAQHQIDQLKCKIAAVESVAARERAKLQEQINQLRTDVEQKTQALSNGELNAAQKRKGYALSASSRLPSSRRFRMSSDWRRQ